MGSSTQSRSSVGSLTEPGEVDCWTAELPALRQLLIEWQGHGGGSLSSRLARAAWLARARLVGTELSDQGIAVLLENSAAFASLPPRLHLDLDFR